jgi:ribonuclease P protein component
MKQTFTKAERLCGHRLVGMLYEKGEVFHVRPFRVTWMPHRGDPAPYPARVLIIVPKRNFRHSVQRNLIRRRIREAYRRNKHTLYEGLSGSGSQIIFSVTYTAKELVPFAEMQEKIILLLQRLSRANEKVAGYFPGSADPHLPGGHLPVPDAVVQVHPQLFGLRRRRHQEVWAFPRRLVGTETHREMPSVGRKRV